MTVRITAELDGQPVPVDQHSFADEKTICAVMRLMAPFCCGSASWSSSKIAEPGGR